MRLFMFLLVGCAAPPADDTDTDTDTDVAQSSVVGPEGGTVARPGVELVVPAGALTDPVEITIDDLGAAPSGYAPATHVFRFGPAGLQFDAPAEIRFDVTFGAPRVFWTDDVAWTELAATLDGGAAVALVEHFSDGFAATGCAPTDPDADTDGVCDDADNCVDVVNADQADADGDGDGDACDLCFGDASYLDPDADGWCSDVDNCVGIANDQADGDTDGTGDACDLCLGHDGTADLDADGLCGDTEAAAGTDPVDADTDDDGLTDAAELAASLDPTDPDTNADGLCDDRRVDGEGDGLDVASDCVTPWFVDVAAVGGDGRSWATAFATLGDAVDASVPGDEIWLATGTFVAPGAGAHLVTLVPGVAVRGGFVGTETRATDRPDPLVRTVLSGDADHSGTFTGADAATVVVGADAVVLDGLTISGGSTAGSGGGLRVPAGAAMTAIDCEITGNRALWGGGAWVAGTLTLEDTVVHGNLARTTGGSDAMGGGVVIHGGGALYVHGGGIDDNVAEVFESAGRAWGGGVQGGVGAILELVDTSVSGNTAVTTGTDVYGGGLMLNGTALTAIRSSIDDNLAVSPYQDAFGGGIYHLAGNTEIVLIDTSISRNAIDGGSEAGAIGLGAWIVGGSLTMDGCAVDDNVGHGEGGQCAGLCLQQGGVHDVRDSTFSGNRMETAGRNSATALSLFGNETTVIGVQAVGNVASNPYNAGHAIDVGSWDDTLVTDVLATDNVGVGGVGANSLTRLTVERIESRRNLGIGRGGGLFVAGSVEGATLTDLVLTDNVGDTGGGLHVTSGLPLTVTRLTATGNSARQGGGLYTQGTGTLVIADATLADNDATQFGAMYVEGMDVTLIGATIADNVSTGGTAATILLQATDSVTFRNTVLWDALTDPFRFNVASDPVFDHSCTVRSFPGATATVVLTADPLERTADGWFLAAGSPCADLGDDAVATGAGIAWATMTTRVDGALDASPVDAGVHHAP